MSYNTNTKRFRGSSPKTEYEMNEYYNQGGYGGSNMELYHKVPNQRMNNILIYTILNQKYVVTIEAIWKISCRFGTVLRVVMIRKKGTQALVEFEDTETARRAMDALQNQDIYSGCCTLKVDFSKTTKLNVRRNDANTWDFTVQPNLTAEATRQPLITQQNHGYDGAGGYSGHHSGGHYNQGNQYYGTPVPRGGMQEHTRTPVCIIYGLTERVNCQHLFNILCLYGNVNKVKFMKSKPGCAMIEFTDTEAVTKSQRLTGLELFGSKLTVRPSKSMFIGEPKGDSFHLADKSIGFEDFSQSKFNRFTTQDKANKNRVQEPRSTLHFFNSPIDMTEETIQKLIAEEEEESLTIMKTVFFPKKEGSKSSSGLIDLQSSGEAMTCLALFNHITIETDESSYPYNIKFCFATQDLRD